MLFSFGPILFEQIKIAHDDLIGCVALVPFASARRHLRRLADICMDSQTYILQVYVTFLYIFTRLRHREKDKFKLRFIYRYELETIPNLSINIIMK